uniref:Uncharacterized protein n=1 Tax=Arundo donax TaxID=35708 RepID=A0A0A9B9R7_ARUDO
MGEGIELEERGGGPAASIGRQVLLFYPLVLQRTETNGSSIR